ncbi:MAG: phosphocholine cytidylyltransferase family protein [Sedimentisphaerales bacterium]|jgi:choline kinase|nr:phosphocholine cytidylyltransferase family protein [Sedimentisphaerales bacterium]HOI36675.1 phosphocholine cytidylyltransferase family protein [Bacillota bacterium]HQN36141.1 phosphocholine cytidylyltransferase family protein [Sedimentisphaerales bacterium]
MQALILAAGRGSRLGSIGEGTPKCLLRIGRRPLIGHQLKILAEAGVAPVAMVVGYCADEIREAVGIRAEYIINPRWAHTNSLYSFYLARNWIKGSVVVLNSDVLFHPQILHRLLSAGGDAIAYDSSSGDAPEHMKVRVADGQLIDMSKDMDADLSCGENVGILSFTQETVQQLFEKAKTMLEASGEQDWIGAAVREMARERRIQAVDVAGLPWAEIDSAQDLDTARHQVWPAIEKGRSHVRRIGYLVGIVLALLLASGLAMLGVHVSHSEATTSWEVSELSLKTRIDLVGRGRTQMWWLIGDDATVVESISGPGTLRVDSRLLLEPGAQTETPYVLSIEIDGEVIDWFKENAKASGTWTHSDWTVGKLNSIDLDLTPGSHVVSIRFMSTPKAPACAIRLRRPEPADPD